MLLFLKIYFLIGFGLGVYSCYFIVNHQNEINLLLDKEPLQQMNKMVEKFGEVGFLMVIGLAVTIFWLPATIFLPDDDS